MGPRGKQLGSSGFESRRTHPQLASPGPLTHYCILREDLPRGVLAAQLIHAAGESSPGDLPKNTFAVALAARDATHLEFVESKLQDLGIPHHAIREPDEPWNGALMAIGIPPVEDRNTLKKAVSSLPLLR